MVGEREDAATVTSERCGVIEVFNQMALLVKAPDGLAVPAVVVFLDFLNRTVQVEIVQVVLGGNGRDVRQFGVGRQEQRSCCKGEK